MPHKNYFLYIPDSEERAQAIGDLKKQHGDKSIYELNASDNFVAKTSEDASVYKIMETVGLNDDRQIVGVMLELSPEMRNGWYNKSFWDWLREPLLNKESDKSDA